MKKKILLFVALISILACFFVISASAETPSLYIEFGAKFPGSDEYITVYTENAEDTGNPRINFADKKFYSDVDFTQEVDMSTAIGIDLSVAKTYANGVEGKAPTRMTKPSTPFVNCVEVKWFTQEKAMDYTIPSSMFYGWSSLKSFDFGNLKKLGDNAFEGCGFETLVIPATITNIYSRTFAKNASLTSLTFEGSTTIDGNGNSFAECASLKSVNLGNSVSYIGKGAFYKCTALTSIVIPSSVTDIKENAFYECTALTSVIFEGTPQVKSIGNSAFQNVPATNLCVPSSVTSIGKTAYKASGIIEVVIPKSVTSIGGEAFANCKSLATVVFEEGFSGTLGSSAFMGASALTTLTLVEGITNIPSQCFWNVGSAGIIEKVTLPDSVESLAGRAFNGATIKVFEIRETSNLKKITGDAFAGMKQLTSIYLPTGVEITCDNLFQYCHKLEKVENLENVKFNVSSYGENVFPGKTFYECLALKEIKLPLNTTAIAGTAFRYYALERIYIPASVTSINKGWLDDKTHIPSTTVIFYCGGDAQKLLSLTDDGEGNVSTRLAGIIQNGNTFEYSGINAEYASGCIVSYANTCDVYYGGVHMENDTRVYTYAGLKYLSELKVTCPCGRNCGEESIIAEIQPLFVSQGYSVTQYGNGGISVCFAINKSAIAQYETLTNSKVNYGLFAGLYDSVGTKEVINVDDQTAILGAIRTDMTGRGYDLMELKMSGFTTDEQKSKKIIIGAYIVINNEVSYLQNGTPNDGDKYSFVSFNNLV